MVEVALICSSASSGSKPETQTRSPSSRSNGRSEDSRSSESSGEDSSGVREGAGLERQAFTLASSLQAAFFSSLSSFLQPKHRLLGLQRDILTSPVSQLTSGL